MTRKALIGAKILTQSGWRTDHALLIDRPTIVDVVSDSRVPTGFDPVRLGGGMLVPGFIDTQVNGGGAVLFNESPTIDGIRAIAEAHREFRSEERRVGKACVRTCRSRWSPSH